MLLKYNQTHNSLYFYSEDPNTITLPKISRADNYWVIPCTYPDGYMCLKAFKHMYPKARADSEAVTKIKELKTLHETENLIPEEYSFKYPPYLHQLRAINNMLKHKKFALLLEMGLGKTYISLNYIAIQKQLLGHFFTVVVCPKIVLRNWKLECEKYTDLNCWVYEKNKQPPPNTDVLVINYDKLILPYAIDLVKSLNIACYIFDESSRLKSHKSKRSKAVEYLSQYTEYKYLLSGALVLGNPLDTFQPYRILDHGIVGSNFFQFRGKYAILKVQGSRRFVVGYKNLDKLKAEIDPYSLMLKREECIDLPDRVFVKHYYQLNKQQKDMYRAIVSSGTVEVNNINITVDASILKLNKLMQVVSGFIMIPENVALEQCNTCDCLLTCIDKNIKPYTKQCILPPEDNIRITQLGNNNPKLELLKEDLELTEGKVIIWAMYKADIAGIIMVLRESKHHYILSTDNDSDIKFQTDPNIKVYLGQISTGIGTTLTEAQTTIYYSHSLNLEHRLQSLDRNYRISQKQKVLVIDYVCEGTIEERVLELLEKKEDVRSFVQHNALCATCPQSITCLTNKVQPYTHKCIYFDNRLNAERKLTLKIEGISECDG